ncbi:hypothetical protein M378DRAFT_162674 [Amanita muscaria Koide BX008]|uniref:Uncharacterized protein n=1 Tax=Amanita muscaria (strain Koide BX008) TaxID=946122 RepID=A0A0C2X7T3_AMAMK|nr:hypothetical protein M378DRAFT_162674 [Amanita muscaria Koide BX008]
MEPFPWYLGQICSLWRTTFFSMYSEFWSTININAHHRYPHSVWEEAVSVATVFLERTEGRPFSFSVDAKHPCPPILDLFIAESTSWKAVSLCLDDDDENIPLFRNIKNRIPQLRSLAVSIELGMPRDLPLIFEDVPALTHLSLIHLGNWRMDWSLLTQLELSREFNVGRLLRVLSQATNLERLAFNKFIMNPKALSEKNFDPVTLPRLRTLEISGLAILRFLTTPALQGLYISKCRQEPLAVICASFFKRSSCQLQRFGAIQFRPNDFTTILPYMPDLKVLSMCAPLDLTPEFVESMTCRTGEQPLMPQLRVLRLSTIIWKDAESFKKMLESRSSDRFLHSVQELKVIVAWSKSYWGHRDVKHSNIQPRPVEYLYEISTQFQWACNDLDGWDV